MENEEKDNNIKRADKIIRTDYPLIGTIGTYIDAEFGEMSNVEAEIKAMKHKEQIKDKRDIK